MRSRCSTKNPLPFLVLDPGCSKRGVAFTASCVRACLTSQRRGSGLEFQVAPLDWWRLPLTERFLRSCRTAAGVRRSNVDLVRERAQETNQS